MRMGVKVKAEVTPPKEKKPSTIFQIIAVDTMVDPQKRLENTFQNI